jgi:GNAT superfamily N-acetyltransferase
MVEDYENRYLKPGTKHKTFVAESDGKFIGYLIGYAPVGAPEVDTLYDILPVSLGRTAPEFYLRITFVSKAFRSHGVSKALHKLIIEYARAAGAGLFPQRAHILFRGDIGPGKSIVPGRL